MAETEVKSINGRPVADVTARAKIEEIKNAAPGVVFDTVAEMEAYIAENAGTLKVGQDLFIRESDVPDYWWDGTTAVPVETELGEVKKELSELSEAIAEQGKTIPKVFQWANAELPFTENEISGVAAGGGFVTNPTNFADGKTYFRYHAGVSYGFLWTNPNQQKGTVTLTVLSWKQYDKESTGNSSSMYFIYADGTQEIIRPQNGVVGKFVSNADKTLTQIKGNYDIENWILLDMDVLSIVADYPMPSSGTITADSNEPEEDDIPKVFFAGDTTGMTKDNEKVLAFSYKSRTAGFDGYVKMKWQGSSSLDFPKKNFTIKMYSDESCEMKLKKTFKNWKHEGNKYVLKANYIDHTHARNIITANLWSEIVASRPDYDTLPEELRNSPRNGAIDGFPIKLYLNGKYEGIYTWNIGKDDWMFGMDEDNNNHAVLCAEKNNNGNVDTTDQTILSCEFRANAKIDETDWALEVPDTLHDNIKTSFNALIDCVKDTDDDTFKATIGNHLDITSALDYYILVYFSAAVDNTAKNLLMITYDGTKWYCSAYDLDNIWGARGTNTFVGADFQCPEGYQDTNSLLWQRIEKCFGIELYERYLEIRKKVLAFPNVIDKFERFCNLIGTELYAEDVEIYSGIPYSTQNNLKQIRNYFQPRADYVDNCMAEIGTPTEIIPCTGITLSESALTFTGAGKQTITATVTPNNTTDKIVWTSNNGEVARVSGGVVTAVGNGSATIIATCGSYSASCEVTVSGIVADTSVLYALENPVTITSANDAINTGVALWESDIDFTIATKANRAVTGSEHTLFNCNNYDFPWNGITCAFGSTIGSTLNAIGDTYSGGIVLEYGKDYTGEIAMVVTHTANSGKYSVVYSFGGEIFTGAKEVEFNPHTNVMGIGVGDIGKRDERPWNGSVEDFRILNRVMSDEEIMAYLE